MTNPDNKLLNAEVQQSASVILAAGKGSRMIGYDGNKTLLPLIPGSSVYDGEHPLLIEVLKNLPAGPKGIVVHHCAEDVKSATEGFGASYLFQAATNGTGGALIASKPFLESSSQESVIITMGDVPLIRSSTYRGLVRHLDVNELAILAFIPDDKAQYGMLETRGDHVVRIVEWKYWHTSPIEKQESLRYCNAGVYAMRRRTLLKYLGRLAANPHKVRKQRGEQWVDIEEYFLTDIVELMSGDGLPVGVMLGSEEEVTGVDTPEALKRVQEKFAKVSGVAKA